MTSPCRSIQGAHLEEAPVRLAGYGPTKGFAQATRSYFCAGDRYRRNLETMRSIEARERFDQTRLAVGEVWLVLGQHLVRDCRRVAHSFHCVRRLRCRPHVPAPPQHRDRRSALFPKHQERLHGPRGERDEAYASLASSALRAVASRGFPAVFAFLACSAVTLTRLA